MKFIHTADIHWGMVPDSDRFWSRERTQAIKDILPQIVTKAKELEVDFLFISGDLFHRQPLQKDLQDVNYLFSTIPSVHVVIIAGNSDPIRSNAALHSFNWAANVTYFMEEKMQSIYFDDCNVEVHGFSCHSSEISEPLSSDQLQAPSDGRTHILMVYGGDSDHLPAEQSDLAESNFTYIALGGNHKPEVVAELKAAFPGSPEPLDYTETGSHGVWLGNISPVTGKVESMEFLPLCQSQYVQLIVNITTQTTGAELEQKISREIERRGTQHIYRLRIRGMRDPDAEFNLQNLASRYRIIEVVDESEPQYDFSALFAEHPSDMIGFYIRAFDKPDPSPVEKKALYYGINALLRTTDERS